MTRIVVWQAALLLLLGQLPGTAAALSPRADLELSSGFSDNVYLDRSSEADLMLRPRVELGADFATFWSAGYSGDLLSYLAHPQLLSHLHQLHLYANPAWGEDGENELLVEFAVETLLNSSEYRSLNHLRPNLQTRLRLEPWVWLRVVLSASGQYRWFFRDPSADAVDGWLQAQLATTLPTRSTVSARLRYGIRGYTRVAAGEDNIDQQLELGAHLGQGLWDSAGLQLDYAYRQILDASGLLVRKLTDDQFAFVGDDFFYAGHRARAGVKQLISAGGFCGAELIFEQRHYPGWVALDSAGATTGVDRQDLRLTPVLFAGLARSPGEDDAAWWPGFEGRLSYAYTRQWSNSDWYDTAAHAAWLNLSLLW